MDKKRAAEGQMQFPRTLSKEECGGLNIMGYRLGDGRSLLFTHDGYENPSLYLVTHEDARIVQSRWRYLQRQYLAHNWPEQEEKDLWKGITMLPMQADPIELWPGEQEARAAHAAAREQWRLNQEAKLAEWLAKHPEVVAAQAARDVNLKRKDAARQNEVDDEANDTQGGPSYGWPLHQQHNTN